ncbi:MAG: phosphatidate cytidylyltransferase [Bacillota bacterium]|jgi:phosphatidate cytidylyltransferase
MLRQRVISAVLAIPLALLAVYYGGWVFSLLVLAMTTLAWRELIELLGVPRDSLYFWWGWIWLILLLLAAWLAPANILPIISFATIALLALQLRGYRPENRPLAMISLTALLYIALPGVHFVLLRYLPYGRQWVTLLLLCTWAYDTGAFFVGMRFGRRRPWPLLSPKKSVEGMIGGFIGSLSAAWILLHYFVPSLSGAEWIGLGALLGAGVGILAHTGDMVESAMKRTQQVKDSGAFLPGHGGVLDRIDSLLFVIPFVYYFVTRLLL